MKPVALSKLLQEQPSVLQAQTLRAVDKRIGEIDTISQRYQQATIVFLSNNLLRQVGQVEQFSLCHTLSLAHNLINSI